jgi:hypothetical protein
MCDVSAFNQTPRPESNVEWIHASSTPKKTYGARGQAVTGCTNATVLWCLPCALVNQHPCTFHPLPESWQAMFYVYDLILALQYLHRRRVIHRDLKLCPKFFVSESTVFGNQHANRVKDVATWYLQWVFAQFKLWCWLRLGNLFLDKNMRLKAHGCTACGKTQSSQVEDRFPHMWFQGWRQFETLPQKLVWPKNAMPCKSGFVGCHMISLHFNGVCSVGKTWLDEIMENHGESKYTLQCCKSHSHKGTHNHAKRTLVVSDTASNLIGM